MISCNEKSSLWVEKYRPNTIQDLILPRNVIQLFEKYISESEIQNMLFSGTAGIGKTSTTNVLVNELKADSLFINASLETGVETIRYKVQQFVMTSSFSDSKSKKIVIIDECDRMSAQAQDSIKSLIETTEKNARFIFTTNNPSKIIDPIHSRCGEINFNFAESEIPMLQVSFFKRICEILTLEKVEFDKKALADFMKKYFPDFRKTLDQVQRIVKMHGKINSETINLNIETNLDNLINSLKTKNFAEMRKTCCGIDSVSFYSNFYAELDNFIQDSCRPNIILLLAKYAYESGISVAKELSLVACCVDIMETAKWK